MCPACIASITFIAASATSSGGLSVLAMSRFYRRKQTNQIKGNQNETARDGTKNKSKTKRNRFGNRVAYRPKRFADARKRIHAPARRAERGPASTADGEDRQRVRFRRPKRERDAGRSLRRPKPTHRLPLYVRPGLGGRLQKLLLSGRPLRWRKLAFAASRRDLRRDLSRAVIEAGKLQKADGLAF